MMQTKKTEYRHEPIAQTSEDIILFALNLDLMFGSLCGPFGFFLGLWAAKTAQGYTHIVKQLLYSMFPCDNVESIFTQWRTSGTREKM